MRFRIIYTDDTSYEFTGGCFGYIGRTDSYSPYDSAFDSVEAFNDRNDFGTNDDSDIPDWRRSPRGGKVAKYLVLTSDFYYGDPQLVEKLYHSSRLELLDYLCTRSPYAPCFKEGSTANGIINDNEVILNAQDVSSELVISLGYVLRKMCDDRIVLNWKAVRSACPEMPEFLSLALAYSMGDLYRASAAGLSAGYGDGTLLPDDFSFRRLYDADPYLSDISISDAGGYVMNVSGMWRDGARSDSDGSRTQFNRLINKHAGDFEVQGVFGKFRASGIKDLRSFLLDINDLFSKGK